MAGTRYHITLDEFCEWGEVEKLADGRYRISAGAVCEEVEARWVNEELVSLLCGAASTEALVHGDGDAFTVTVDGHTLAVQVLDERAASQIAAGRESSGPVAVTVTMPGKVIRIPVAPGDTVAKGDPVIVVEAMKMENEITAPRDGVVTAIHVAEGASVEAGVPLVTLE